MRPFTTTGVGQYVAAERHMLVADVGYLKAAARPGVVYCQSHGNDALQVAAAGWIDQVTRALAGAGYSVLGCDLGGAATWGNDTVQARISSAVAYLQATLGARAGKIGLLGTSMGALAALNWARANPDSVACIALGVPVVDLAYEHDNTAFGTEIETAYGGAAAYAAAVASHDPIQNVAAHAAGPAIKMWRASNDAVAITARQDAFAAAVGCELTNLGPVGHTPASIDPVEATTFMERHL